MEDYVYIVAAEGRFEQPNEIRGVFKTEIEAKKLAYRLAENSDYTYYYSRYSFGEDSEVTAENTPDTSWICKLSNFDEIWRKIISEIETDKHSENLRALHSYNMSMRKYTKELDNKIREAKEQLQQINYPHVLEQVKSSLIKPEIQI